MVHCCLLTNFHETMWLWILKACCFWNKNCARGKKSSAHKRKGMIIRNLASFTGNAKSPQSICRIVHWKARSNFDFFFKFFNRFWWNKPLCRYSENCDVPKDIKITIFLRTCQIVEKFYCADRRFVNWKINKKVCAKGQNVPRNFFFVEHVWNTVKNTKIWSVPVNERLWHARIFCQSNIFGKKKSEIVVFLPRPICIGNFWVLVHIFKML